LLLTQGWSAATTLGTIFKSRDETLKGFGGWRTLSGLFVFLVADPGLSLRSNPGLQLANAFGVIWFKLMHHSISRGNVATQLSP